jgi:hypothetical protein
MPAHVHNAKETNNVKKKQSKYAAHDPLLRYQNARQTNISVQSGTRKQRKCNTKQIQTPFFSIPQKKQLTKNKRHFPP